MTKELTLYFPAGGMHAQFAPVPGKEIMTYLDQKKERELNEYVERMNILVEGDSDDYL